MGYYPTAQSSYNAAFLLPDGSDAAHGWLLQNNYIEGAESLARLGAYSLAIGNVVINTVANGSLQGDLGINPGKAGAVVHHNLGWVASGALDGNIASFGYQYPSCSMSIHHNTSVMSGTDSGVSVHFQTGEGAHSSGLHCQSDLIHDNMALGGTYGILQFNPDSTYTPTVASAGVYNNLTNGQTSTVYSGVSGGGYDNGTTAHPNAIYGDQSFNPSLTVAVPRTIAGFDTYLGGAGTVAHFVAQLSHICGQLGAYNSAYNIGDLVWWVKQGFLPTNQTAATADSGGASIGGVNMPLPTMVLP